MLWSEAAKNLRKKTKNRNRRLVTARKIVGTDERKGIVCFRACFVVVILFGLDRSSTIVVCCPFSLSFSFVVVSSSNVPQGEGLVQATERYGVIPELLFSNTVITSRSFSLLLHFSLLVSLCTSGSRSRSLSPEPGPVGCWVSLCLFLGTTNARTHTHIAECRVQLDQSISATQSSSVSIESNRSGADNQIHSFA